MSGTYSIAVLAILIGAGIQYLVSGLDQYLFSMAVLFLLFIALAWQNRVHAKEQKNWEDNVYKGKKAEAKNKT